MGVVALRKESVDRNNFRGIGKRITSRSLSARRAWIEINVGFPIAAFLLVALRKESVDRNESALINCNSNFTSLSARRAWIEIPRPSITGYFFKSLSARRAWIEILFGRC